MIDKKENGVFDAHGRATIEGAAKYLTIKKSRLYQLRTQGRGPRARKLDGVVYYYKVDLDEYVDSAPYENCERGTDG